MVNELINTILSKIKDLPPLPESTRRIIELTGDISSSAQDLATVLEKDQALTAKVLKLVNSSYYGFSRKISTISQAVMYLGFNTIKSLALTASSYNMLQRDLPAYSMERGMLWKHSIACAACSRIIAKEVHYSDPEEAYIAGLIHDVGKLMLDQYAHDLFVTILDMVENHEIPFDVAEKDILGFDHAEIGGKIAEKWNFPLPLVESISFHHQPEFSTTNQQLTYIVHLADTVSDMIGIGIGRDAFKYQFSPDTLEALHLPEEAIQSFIEQLSEVMNDETNQEF